MQPSIDDVAKVMKYLSRSRRKPVCCKKNCVPIVLCRYIPIAKHRNAGIYILAISLLSQLKNREEFEGGLEKRKGKGGKEEKKEKNEKTHVKIP